MTIYIILLLLLLLAAIIDLANDGEKNTKSKLIYLLFAIFPFLFVSAFRAPSIGVDAFSYVTLFEALKGVSLSGILSMDIYYEKGYLLLNHLIQYFTLNSQSILIFTSIVIIGSIMFFIYRYSVSIFFSVYLFITLAFYYNSMNIIRQYFAIAILTYSISFIKRRKLLPFLLIVFIASLFHSSALIFSIVYLVPLIKFTNKKVLVTLLSTLIIFLFLLPLMEWLLVKIPQYQAHMSYINSNELASLIKTLLLLTILLFGLVVNYHNNKKATTIYFQSKGVKVIEEANTKKRFINNSDENIFSFIMLFAVAISLISFKMSILGRLSEYFAIYAIVYLPNAINKIKDKNIRIILIIVVVFFTLLYNAIIFIYRPEWYQVTPYSLFM